MKSFILFIAISTGIFISCDRIKKPYIPAASTELEQSLYPDNWSNYPWPVFNANTNTNRNILLEDYTGHKCVYCPAAGVIAAQLETANPGRVFVASVHTSPGGTGPFQTTDATYTQDFTNPIVIKYGETFANGFGFDANPKGTINRKEYGGIMFQGAGSWASLVNQAIAQNELKMNLQAAVNYYPSTRGLFLHTEIDTMNIHSSDITIVVSFIENSFIAKQKFPAGEVQDEYHHHNIVRTNIDNQPFGRVILATDLKQNGKYYQNYSYKIPAQYDPANCHLLVYAMNKTTYEIYQVIEVNIP